MRPACTSARYCGRHGDDEANNDKLLQEMAAVPEGQRTAQFVSAVCLMLPDGRSLLCAGTCRGRRISAAEVYIRASTGFGYDPLLIPEQCGVGKSSSRPNTEGRSYAQLTPEEKDAISHRGRALEKLEAQLPDFLIQPKHCGC